MNTEQNVRYGKIKKKLFEAYYSKLNNKQKEAVFCVNGPLLVLAGAGSGKTTVLVNRIAHIIDFGNAYHSNEMPDGITSEVLDTFENILSNVNSIPKEELKSLLVNFAYDNCKPWEILSFTFTNKAASEMKDRLESILGERARDIWAGTFHSICVRILRQHIDRLGYNPNFTIYDTDDSKKLIQNIVKELDLDDEMFNSRSVLSTISRMKNNLIYPDSEDAFSDDFREKSIFEIYDKYQKSLREFNAVDFDDIICLTIKLFETAPDVLDKYSSRFKYVLVDEYQDTNGAQLKLMRLFCSHWENVMVVGDDDQSIYKFRGATVRNILDFDLHFKNAKVIKLEQNYRSTGNIISAANSVIENNVGRKGKVLWTNADNGEKIDYCRLDNQDMEARYIVDRISEYVKSGKYTYRDFAVLYRVNAQSNNLEIAMSKSALPHRLLGGTRFYDRKEIKDIVSYLAVVANPDDTVKLERILNTPKRGIGDTTVSAIKTLASAENVSVYEIIKNADKYTALKKSAQKLILFSDMIESFREKMFTLPAAELIKIVAEESGYVEMLRNSIENEKDRIDNINELISNAIKYNEDNPEGTLDGFLEEVALISDIDGYDKDSDAVVLMTMHSSKGLEFPVVFLPGVEENIIPSSQCQNSDDELEEERRLMYVAITRAREKLIVTNATERLMYGRTSINGVSRFLKEIPTNLIDNKNSGQRARNINAFVEKYQSTNTGGNLSSLKPPANKTPHDAFNVGESVIHPIFGEGIVTLKKAMGGDTLYEVAFESCGTKKLMGTYAKLKKK
ncbi:MAG: ATP-dependent DNA helicase PcrA [Ruminococcaceae bacterium]|nr:ATP-dependent DNA helicase PcrA [Oscillospiraceae bacterium]